MKSRRPTFVVGKGDSDVGSLYFLGEQVFFIEEENHGRVNEPSTIADRLEKPHRFHHSILKCSF